MLVAFSRVCVFFWCMSYIHGIWVPMGGLVFAYINSYVFELHNFYASVPETYIAQMVGWMLMIF